MKKSLLLVSFSVLFVLLLLPFISAYGVTFYNPSWNPQDGQVYDKINAGEPYDLTVRNPDIALTQIVFYVESDFENAGITIYNLRAVPDNLPDLPEATFEVDELKYVGFVPHHTTNMVFYFKVNKTWLGEHSVPRSSIALHYYDSDSDSWIALKTDIKDDDDDFVYYKAEHVGVHYLYIGKTVANSADVPIESVEPVEDEDSVRETQVNSDVIEDDSDEIIEVESPSERGSNLAEVVPVDLQATISAAPLPAPKPETPVESTVSSDESFNTILVLAIVAVVVVIIIIVFGRTRPSVDKELHTYVKNSLKQGMSKDEIRRKLLEVGWHHERVTKVLSKYKERRHSTQHHRPSIHKTGGAHHTTDRKVRLTEITKHTAHPNEEFSDDLQFKVEDPLAFEVVADEESKEDDFGDNDSAIFVKPNIEEDINRIVSTVMDKKKSKKSPAAKKSAEKASPKKKTVKKKSVKKTPAKKKSVKKKATKKKPVAKKKIAKKKVTKKKAVKKATKKKAVKKATKKKPAVTKKKVVKKKAVKSKPSKKKTAKKRKK